MTSEKLDAAEAVSVTPEDVRSSICSWLQETCGVREPVADRAEIYYELGLAGDDLDEFLGWLQEAYNIDFSAFARTEYAPGEWGEPMPLSSRYWAYRSLQVRDLVQAAVEGRWTPTAWFADVGDERLKSRHAEFQARRQVFWMGVAALTVMMFAAAAFRAVA